MPAGFAAGAEAGRGNGSDVAGGADCVSTARGGSGCESTLRGGERNGSDVVGGASCVTPRGGERERDMVDFVTMASAPTTIAQQKKTSNYFYA